MRILAELHPIVVHFIVALYASAVIFDLLYFIYKSDKFGYVSWYNLLIAAAAGLLAVFTGLQAERHIMLNEISQAVFDQHQFFAFAVLVIVFIQFFWRLGRHGNMPSAYTALYMLFSLAGLCCLALTAYYGGLLVHTFQV